MSFSATRKSPPPLTENVEVRDSHGRPLLHVPLTAAMRQKLPFSLALLALGNRKGGIFLHKRPPGPLGHEQTWDLFTAPVLPDETGEDTAIRLFTHALGSTAPAPATAPRIAESPATRERPLHLLLFRCVLPTGMLPPNNAGLLLVDADELAGLAAQIPELLAPTLLWAASTGCLFQR